jgi:host factor-I protein
MISRNAHKRLFPRFAGAADGAPARKCYRVGRLRVGGEARRAGSTKWPRQAAQRTKRDKLMPSEKTQNLQDTFLNHVRKTKTSVTIFLVNGVKLTGFVTWFDNFCVLLRRDGHSQLVYKHAISTIMPASPITMFEAADEDAEQH